MIKYLILLSSLAHTGDVSHTQALVEKLMQESSVMITQLDTENPDLIAAYERLPFIKESDKLNETMILAVGEKGLQALSALNNAKALPPALKQGASLHLHFDLLKTLPLTFLSLPESQVHKDAIAHIPNVITTLTVPTKNPSLPELRRAYNTWPIPHDAKPDAHEPCIVVMLAGDAIDETGKIRCFTKKSAAKLARDVIELRKQLGSQHRIIIQNGPRTGKHNEAGAVVCNHEYAKGTNVALAIDGVSQHFMDLLKTDNVPYDFFNFAFEVDGTQKKALSVFNPLLYVVQMRPDNYFILPGESVSMLAQVPLYLDPAEVIVFKADSMSPAHEAIFETIKQRGHLSYLSNTGEVIPPKNPVKMEKDDVATVVNGIQKCFKSEEIKSEPVLWSLPWALQRSSGSSPKLTAPPPTAGLAKPGV